MFDANMGYLPKGHKFFAEIYSCTKNGTEYGYGIRRGYLIECEMLNDDPDNAKVFFCGKFQKVIHDSDDLSMWAVYAGNTDGTGFICDKAKAKAMKQLKNTYRTERY
jgi:hypothetical protein